MERLKVLKFLGLSTLAHLFTFQYGEIKSQVNKRARRYVSDLHSSMERLKASGTLEFAVDIFNLHSSMERLKAEIPPADKIVPYGFTFQYGEIKSSGKRQRCLEMLVFTFQYGEIKRRILSTAARGSRHLHSSMERLKEARYDFN